MTGIVSPLQSELFSEVLRVIEEQTGQIKRIEQMIQKYTTDAYNKAAEAIDVIPGIGRISAEQIIAEIGIDMLRFPTPHHLCSWSGVCFFAPFSQDRFHGRHCSIFFMEQAGK